MQVRLSRVFGGPLSALVLLALTACAVPKHRAPVEDRTVSAPKASGNAPAPAVVPETSPVLPGAENAGKPGYYTVKPGDTLIRIALDNGQNWRDLAKWNSLDKPNLIEVGQVLRVLPPGSDSPVSTKPVAAARVESKPLEGKPAASANPASTAASAATATAAAASAVARTEDDEIVWGWPTAGAVSTPFDEVRNKGLGFAGKAGDPVLAAADGRVMYAGSGLRGYGNMVIIKHSTNYLTAYAHNQTLLVKEDQVVRKGQKIAEMGSSDADQVKLHFELRKQGKPVDPTKLLPAR